MQILARSSQATITALVLTGFVLSGCGSADETPRAYESEQMRFSYPAGWELEVDQDEAGAVTARLDGDASSECWMIVRPLPAVDLEAFARLYSEHAAERLPLGEAKEGRFQELERTLEGRSLAGVRERFVLQFAGFNYLTYRDWFALVGKERVAFLMCQAFESELEELQASIDQFLASFRLKDGESELKLGAVAVDPVRPLAASSRWKLPPLVPGSWQDVPHSDALGFSRQLLGADPVEVRDPARRILRMRWLDLPFYDKGILVEAQTSTKSSEPAAIVFVVNAGQVTVLNGTSAVIHALNDRAGLRLESEGQVDAYLRFFSSTIEGDEGPFQIITEPSDFHWQERAAPAAQDALYEELTPFRISKARNGTWKATASVLYGGNLFSAVLTVSRDGLVEMNEDVPVRDDLPVRRIQFEGAVRREMPL